jgi:hypothetical protein
MSQGAGDFVWKKFWAGMGQEKKLAGRGAVDRSHGLRFCTGRSSKPSMKDADATGPSAR